jgi:serine/threonine protein kinase
MNADRWKRVNDLFQSAVERARGERAAFLDEACHGDEGLRREVGSLVTSYERSGNFIELPAFEVAPELLTNDTSGALVGTLIGHYRIESLIGVGGMGEVYLARDERLGRKAALKLLPDSLTTNETQVSRFKNEARSASALNHPNILTVYEIGAEGDRLFIATEFIEGATLRASITCGRINPHAALEIAVQVASALAAAHEAGVVHRDIKPENIMLRPDGYAKVLDFGIAKLTEQTLAPNDHTGEPTAALQTRQGLVLGTARYMSPEQARGQKVDARSDIWSLGVVLYEMVGGSPPFCGETPSDCIAAILTTEPSPLSAVSPDVPLKLESILQKALRKNSDERYQTIKEMLADLRPLKGELETDSPLPPIKAHSESIVSKIKRHKRGVLFTLVSALAAAAVAYSFFFAAPAQLPNKKSIAVLPFENLSEEKSNAYFADGIQDEILTRLSKIADLKVISRTSVMKYKRHSQQNLRNIANTLQVSHVVEGSVQNVGGRIRVSAQLIDAHTDAHLWAEHYDRDVADVFAIQTEIAQRIADQLRTRLSAAEKAAIAERPTADPVAFAYYIEAKAISDGEDWEGKDKPGDRAIELLDKATERDPNFALAYCALAKAHCALFPLTTTESDLAQTHLDLAKRAADTALRIHPEYADAHLELARYYFLTGDFDRALAESSVARRKLPNNSEALCVAARIDRRQNRWDSAVINLQKAHDLDPANAEVALFLGQTYFDMRRYSAWEELIQRCAESGTFKEPYVQRLLAEIRLAGGDPVAAQSLLQQVPLEFSPDPWTWEIRFQTALCLRDYDAADQVIAAMPAKFADGFHFRCVASHEGHVARARGDKQKAEAIFLNARKKPDVLWGPKDKTATYFSLVAELDAGLGRKEEAIREAQRAVELNPIASDSLGGPNMVQNLALVYAWTGDHGHALDQLEIVAKIPAGPTYGDLRFNPCWDSLRGDKRFGQIIAVVQAATK